MRKFVQIAIDGPAAAGKSTIAKIVAQDLGYVYIDTGAMYRAITLAVLNNHVAIDDEDAIAKLLNKTNIVLNPSGQVLINDLDVTVQIREHAVTSLVAQVAAYEPVRKALKQQQIALANTANVIMDGRDIGTNVLPMADFKFFMIADARVRAVRRYEENLKIGVDSNLDDLEAEIKKRDEMDVNRAYAPLKQAKDAILIDTSALSINEVVDKILGYVFQTSIHTPTST